MKHWYFILAIMLLLGSGVLVQAQDMPSALGIQWSPDGRWIAVNSRGGLWLFNAENPEEEARVFFEGEDIPVFDFDPNGTYLTAIVGNFDNDTVILKQIDIDTGEIVLDFVLSYWDATIYDALYSRDGEKLLVAADNAFSVLNPQTGEKLEDISTSLEYSYDTVIVSADQIRDTGNYVVSNNGKDIIIVNDEAGILETRSLAESSFYSIFDIKHLEASHFLLHTNDGIYQYSIADDSLELLVPALEENSIAGFAYFPESEIFLTGSMVGETWQLYDVATREIILEFTEENSDNAFFGFDFNPDGSQFVSLRSNGRITIWDTETGEALAELGNFERGYSIKWG